MSEVLEIFGVLMATAVFLIVLILGSVAAVVLPYFWMLLYTLSSLNPSFCCTNWAIRRFAWWGMSMSISDLFRPF